MDIVFYVFYCSPLVPLNGLKSFFIIIINIYTLYSSVYLWFTIKSVFGVVSCHHDHLCRYCVVIAIYMFLSWYFRRCYIRIDDAFASFFTHPSIQSEIFYLTNARFHYD